MGPYRNPDIRHTQIFINNEWHDSVNGKTYTPINPVTEEVICEVQEGDESDVDKAVQAAVQAFKLGSKWRTMDASARGRLIYRLSDLIERDVEFLASLDSICNGKVYKDALEELHTTINLYRYYAGWADKIHGKTIPADGTYFAYTRMEPVGVCGLILPWDFPSMLTCHKLAPALATGCTMIVKPAEQTPLSTLHVASLIKEAGFPPGVVNVVPGYGATGQALVEHPDVNMISFTGSTEVGSIIQQLAGKSSMKRVTLETGGKSPLVVCADADIDFAVQVSQHAAMYNQGQSCCSGTRTFVQEDIYEEFVEKSKMAAAARIVGDPFDNTTINGPLVDKDQFDKVLDLIESGKTEGATVECGGERLGEQGYFVMPTVFSGVEDHMRIAREEIFGPVMQILKFKTLDEVLERANATHYGLAAGIITTNIKTALMFAHGVRAGSIWINKWFSNIPQAPFGGFKMSGFGRECGEDGLLPYLEIKSVVIKIPEKNS